MTCRSSDPCTREAGHGMFGSFCEVHADEMRQLRMQPHWHGRDVVEDALTLAYAVLGTGRLLKADLKGVLPGTGLARDIAIDVAVARGWVEQRGSNGMVPGRTLPPDLPLELRALVLAQDLRDSIDVDEIAADELAFAVERGWLTPDLAPGEVVPFVGPKVSLVKRKRKPRKTPTLQPRKAKLTREEYAEKRAAEREKQILVNANAIVRVVENADHAPVTREELRAATGLGFTRVADAAQRAAKDGRIMAKSGVGYFPIAQAA